MTGKRGEREIQHVGGLVDHLGAPCGFGQLGRFLAQLGAEQRRIGEQLGGVGAVRRRDPALRQTAGERAKAAVIAPAGARVQMAETGRLLAHREAQAVAIAVGIDPQQLLGGAGRGALDPQAARA